MATIRLNDDVFERAKMHMDNRSWNQFLDYMMDRVYGTPGANSTGTNYTSNNAPGPKPAPVPMDTNSLERELKSKTFPTMKDAKKAVDNMNKILGIAKYFIVQETINEIPVFTAGYHPMTTEEKAEHERKNSPTNDMGWSEYLNSIRSPKQECAVH